MLGAELAALGAMMVGLELAPANELKGRKPTAKEDAGHFIIGFAAITLATLIIVDWFDVGSVAVDYPVE